MREDGMKDRPGIRSHTRLSNLHLRQITHRSILTACFQGRGIYHRKVLLAGLQGDSVAF